jgi:hypothetical protein
MMDIKKRSNKKEYYKSKVSVEKQQLFFAIKILILSPSTILPV